MAFRVYRFKQQDPGVDLTQIESEIDSPLTLNLASAGGFFVDISVDEASSDDLIQSLAARGFSLIEADPVSPASRDYLEQTLENTTVPGISLTGSRFTEASYSGGRLVTSTTWTNSSKVKKLEELFFVYTGSRVTTIITQRYDPSGPGVGTKISEEQEFLTYSGIKTTSIDAVKVL